MCGYVIETFEIHSQEFWNQMTVVFAALFVPFHLFRFGVSLQLRFGARSAKCWRALYTQRRSWAIPCVVVYLMVVQLSVGVKVDKILDKLPFTTLPIYD